MAESRRITGKTKIYQLRIQLRHVRPPIWRRALVPGEMTLAELHDVIQTAMGWTNTHLHEFEIDDVSYGEPDPEGELDEVADDAKVKLFRVAHEGGRIRYAYDFGDGWEHDVLVEKVASPQPGSRYPSCIAGRRACPPEDVGGPWGYQEFLAALSDPNHEEHTHWTEWIGGSFDPNELDLAAVNEALKDYAWADRPTRPTR